MTLSRLRRAQSVPRQVEPRVVTVDRAHEEHREPAGDEEDAEEDQGPCDVDVTTQATIVARSSQRRHLHLQGLHWSVYIRG